MIHALALALCVTVQAPPVVLADGPARDVIVVVEGKAYRVRTVEVIGPSPTPEPPTPPKPPEPDPTPSPDQFGIIAKVKAAAEPFAKPLRDKMASGYRSTASQIAAGVFNVGATNDDKVRAVNAGHAENMRALLTEQERKDLTPVGDVIRITLKDLWDRKVITDLTGIAAFYRDVAAGLQGP